MSTVTLADVKQEKKFSTARRDLLDGWFASRGLRTVYDPFMEPIMAHIEALEAKVEDMKRRNSLLRDRTDLSTDRLPIYKSLVSELESYKEKLVETRHDLEQSQQRVAQLEEALQALYDEQNDVPLYTRAAQWHEAMTLAEQALAGEG